MIQITITEIDAQARYAGVQSYFSDPEFADSEFQPHSKEEFNRNWASLEGKIRLSAYIRFNDRQTRLESPLCAKAEASSVIPELMRAIGESLAAEMGRQKLNQPKV